MASSTWQLGSCARHAGRRLPHTPRGSRAARSHAAYSQSRRLLPLLQAAPVPRRRVDAAALDAAAGLDVAATLDAAAALAAATSVAATSTISAAAVV